MGIDDELRAAEERLQEERARADDKAARRSAAQAAYHAAEAELTAELVAAAERTLDLLRERRADSKVQVWARSRWPTDDGFALGWPIPDPVYGTGFGSIARVLLSTGEVAVIQRGTKRSHAHRPISLQTWIARQVKRARTEISTVKVVTRADYYDLAFGRYAWLENAELMHRQLESMRGLMFQVFAEMRSPGTRADDLA